MGRIIDLTNCRFGRLIVIERAENFISPKSGKKEVMWRCRCDCGNEIDVLSSSLRRGFTKSCGCLWNENINMFSTKHGACSNHMMTRLYKIWMNMRKRCYNENSYAFKNYGARGIKVCDEWMKDFSSFEKWAYSSGYSDDLTIDRIDVNGNYCPENCRWATMKEQANNKRNNKLITVNGNTKTMTEWSAISGISTSTIWARINIYGWSDFDAVFAPIRGDKYGK